MIFNTNSGILSNLLNKKIPKRTSITILPSDWNNKSCTKPVLNMNPDLIIIAFPSDESSYEYFSSIIKVSSQSTDLVTFSCETTPLSAVVVNLIIIDADLVGGGLSSLVIGGDWTNYQYTGSPVDITGLSFTAVYGRGSELSIDSDSVIISPTTWGTSPSQTCVFSYTDNGVTVFTNKIANMAYTYSTVSGGHGSVSGSGNYIYDASSPQTKSLTYTPDTGYYFTGWTTTGGSDCSASGNTLTIGAGCYGNITATASFEYIIPVSLVITGDWTNTQFCGDPVDYTGLTFTVNYNDGTSTTVTPDSVSPSIWGSSAGTQTATFSFTDKGETVTATKDATVISVIPISLSITGDWTNTQYAEHLVDYTGLTFTATYNNGTSATVTPTSLNPSIWGSTVGTQSCTFSYTEDGTTVSASKSANVLEVIPVSLVVTGDWTNDQNYGEAPDTTGLTFTVTYNNGMVSTVTPSISPATWSSVGTQTATFSYTERGVTVSDTKTAIVYNILSSIAITTQPSTRTYIHYSTFDSTGAVITASWADGTTSDITSSATWSPLTLDTLGTQIMTVSYTYRDVTRTDTTTVTVNKALSGIAITTQPTTRTYNYGDTFSSAGAVITATYSDNTTADVTSSTTWSPSTLTTVGTQVMTASYTYEGTTKTDTTTVTVDRVLLSLSISGDWANEQCVDDAVDTTGLIATASYNDGTTADVISSCTVTPSVWGSTVGTQTATFSYTYNGVTKTDTKDANVVEPFIISNEFRVDESIRNIVFTYGS